MTLHERPADLPELARTAGNGAEALEHVCAAPAGSILMDMDMPIMDGLEATRRIGTVAALNWRIPIVAMTAHAFGKERDRWLAAGMMP